VQIHYAFGAPPFAGGSVFIAPLGATSVRQSPLHRLGVADRPLSIQSENFRAAAPRVGAEAVSA